MQQSAGLRHNKLSESLGIYVRPFGMTGIDPTETDGRRDRQRNRDKVTGSLGESQQENIQTVNESWS